MRHLDPPVNGSDLVDSLDLRTEPSMDTEDLSVNNSPDGQVIEDLSAVLPRVRISILSIDLIVKSINSCDLSALIHLYLDSWLPLSRVILSGYFTFRHNKY